MKKRLIILCSVLGAAVVILLLSLSYMNQGSKYKTVLYPNTYINNVDCSELTAQDAEQKILKSYEPYSMTVTFRDGRTETITASDIDYQYSLDSSVQEIIDSTTILFWRRDEKRNHEYTIERSESYSEEKLAEKINSFTELDPATMIVPANAYIDFSNNEYNLIPAIDGTMLNAEAVQAAIEGAVYAGKTEFDVEAEGFYEEPAVKTDDVLLNNQLTQFRTYANADIKYTLPAGLTAEITPEMLRNWLTVDPEGNYVWDEDTDEKLLVYISEISSQITAATTNENGQKTQPFQSTLDGVVNVTLGTYSTFTGYSMDIAAEFDLVKSQILEHAYITREPKYSSSTGSSENYGIGKTYVEVNLSRQHMWYYQDGQLMMEANIVSGCMTTWRYTPEGIYTVSVKSSPHTMKGEIDPLTNLPIYTAECTYWMNFIPALGIGFHDYDSRWDWSSTAYLYNGSHGCINMHGTDAALLYGMLEKGTTVVAYYSEPYTLEYESGAAGRSTPVSTSDDTEDDSDDDETTEESSDSHHEDQTEATPTEAPAVETETETQTEPEAESSEPEVEYTDESGGEEGSE